MRNRIQQNMSPGVQTQID